MGALPYIFIGVSGVVSGILSGISGGGGGMLMIPAFILVGIPPQNAVATGKMNGLGAAFGGLWAFSKSGHIRKDILKVMIPTAVVVGITTPFVFSAIDSKAFQLILGVILILLIPTLFLKKKAVHTPTRKHRIAGYISYTGVLVIQSLFGSGVGSLALFVLTLLFGTTKLEANATKRAVMAVLTPITFVALLVSGFVVLSYGIVGLASVFVGTHFGSKIALKKGDQFVSIVMAITIAIAGVVLVVNAVR
ncbi:MAG TPA: sulfite exporter TauE/SafE family protein [Candidatus Saccharimonadales bacterium]|nr:sulfite exporter TauE/SafE family protein [Candidatus Saccharimonadales bacterium]